MAAGVISSTLDVAVSYPAGCLSLYSSRALVALVL